MSKNVLRMKYHAAKKEISFKRFQDGEEIPIKSGGVLSRYINMRGNFVLQYWGNTFFKDIAKVFDGIKNVEIEAIMTKSDYEDLVRMIENYNNEQDRECTFSYKLSAELPDMKEIFEDVKKFGEMAIDRLETNRIRLPDGLPLDCHDVAESAESFSVQIRNEIGNIRAKINSMSDNRVSLCFTGVYSAGKSALINTLLGYRILPESIKSETAKMFQIYSPNKGENEKIMFQICGVYSVIEWNDSEEIFEFKEGPAENAIRKEIQTSINNGQGKRKDEQMECLLGKLNEYEEVSSEIMVEFPIPLDREEVQFTIFDTPGTDSNYAKHQSVLTRALENQTQSILIFVARPDGLEGSGNNALLNYLKEAEKKNSKTSIDISRSLFVINKADNHTREDRIILQHAEIKDQEDGEFTINLANKKLFFTSAKYGFAAKAVINGIADAEAEYTMYEDRNRMCSERSPYARCFRENRSALSEYATKEMIKKCEEALEKAEREGNDGEIVLVCSGIYSLENEIIQYGEKYAAAVKAYAIIDSVKKALDKLENQACSLSNSNKEEIATIERNIEELRKTINDAIDGEYQSRTISTGKNIPEEVRIKLKIDSKTLNETLLVRTENYLNSTLKGAFFGLGKVDFKETDKTEIKDGINGIMAEFTNNFIAEREKLLTSERDAFIGAVKKAINDNGNISEAAKRFFQSIPEPEISRNKGIDNLDGIYNSNKRTEKVWFFFEKERLDKNTFIEDIKDNLNSIATAMTDEYAKDYQESLEEILIAVKNEFEQNLERYSRNMKTMIHNRDAMKKLGRKIEKTAEDLKACQSDLDAIIWEEKK